VTTDPLTQISTRRTPQSQPADARQVANSAGGFTFTVDALQRLRRFLTLGVDGGTYYASARDLAVENAKVVVEFAQSDPATLVHEVVAVSTAGRAPRVQPTIFALAVAASLADVDGRRTALNALPLVARTGTHLFQFVTYVEQFRGWGRALKRAVGAWYTTPPVDRVAFQAVKYRQREGWSHRDLLRLAHPEVAATDPSRRALFNWICGRDPEFGLPRVPEDDPLRIVEGFERVRHETSAQRAAALVRDYRLSWEMLPDAVINTTAVWEALLENGVPATALIRQLPRLTRLGMLQPLGHWTGVVAAQLQDVDRLKRGRVHPINVLVAQRTYASGRGARGSQTWQPSRPVVDALDAAFYAAYGAIEPANRRMLLALDVSGSMDSRISDMPLTCREASAALALVTAATESNYEIIGFTSRDGRHPRTMADVRRNTGISPLAISPRQRLDDVVRTVSGLPFGGTDCALPMLYAAERNLEVDSFVVYTDNETWHGDVHPFQALRDYRQKTGIPARLTVVGMTATRFTIADPSDPGMLDVAGFDSTVPQLISDFARGDV
jgi:60 kDa SS-A/Ro ribonucleoprotein